MTSIVPPQRRPSESEQEASERSLRAPNILALAQQQRFVVEDFTPLPDSLEWLLGQRYWRDRGSKAFISDSVPVPWAINNDGTLSRKAAELLFTSLLETEPGAGPIRRGK